MLESLINTVVGGAEKLLYAVPPRVALLGILQLAGGKFFKKYTTEDTPNELIMPFQIATSMVGWMLIYSGAHPDWDIDALAKESVVPAIKQYAGVTALHNIGKNGSKLASLGKVALSTAVSAIPGASVVGKILSFLKLKK